MTAVVRLWAHLETLDEMPLDTLTIDQASLTVWPSSGRLSRWVPLRNTDQDRSRQIYICVCVIKDGWLYQPNESIQGASKGNSKKEGAKDNRND